MSRRVLVLALCASLPACGRIGFGLLPLEGLDGGRDGGMDATLDAEGDSAFVDAGDGDLMDADMDAPIEDAALDARDADDAADTADAPDADDALDAPDVPAITTCPFDADDDGDLDADDLAAFRAAYGSGLPAPTYQAIDDFDADGDVDFADYGELWQRFGAVGYTLGAGCLTMARCPGDIDGDGDVDAADLFVLSRASGSFLTAGPFDPRVDLDADGDVDDIDTDAFRQVYRMPGTPPACPPIACLGDFTRDGDVDREDVDTMSAALGSTASEQDFDRDGDVDSDDWSIFLPRAFGSDPSFGMCDLRCIQDLDGDGDVDARDRTALTTAIGTSRGDLGYDARVDYDGDNAITVADLNILRVNLGRIGLAPPICTPAATCQGDFDADGDIDALDNAAFLVALDTVAADPSYNPFADMDLDNDVDATDQAMFDVVRGGRCP